jgi:hypothetical protein
VHIKFSSINFCPWKLKTDFWNCDTNELQKLRCSKKILFRIWDVLGSIRCLQTGILIDFSTHFLQLLLQNAGKMSWNMPWLFKWKMLRTSLQIFRIVAVFLSYSACSLVGGYQRNHNINFHCSENLIWAVSNHHPTRCRYAEDDDMNHPSNNKYHLICLKLLTEPVVLSKERVWCKPYRTRYFDLVSHACLLGRACSTNGGE